MQIVKFTISADYFMSDEWGAIYEKAGEALQALPNQYTDEGALVCISGQPAQTEDTLKSLNVPFSKEDITGDFSFYITNAPERYDYDYCVQVAQNDANSRIVAIPVICAPAQTARYASGLFYCEKVKNR